MTKAVERESNMKLRRFKYLLLVLSIGLVGFRFQTNEGYVSGKASGNVNQQAMVQSADEEKSVSSVQKGASEDVEFQRALDDTKVATASEISKNLGAIVSQNSSLTWSNGRVLMTAWANDYYKRYNAGDYFTISPSHLVWVFPSYEVKNFLNKNKIPKKDLNDRLKKLLGLRPETKNTLFVEFWVRPIDMYRPSPDPEISDQEAELAFPENPYYTISQTYKDWFNNRKATIYTGSSAYPWTGLGYTYDWGNRKSHIGLSEYVIVGGALVQIRSITPTEQYR